MDLQQLRQTQLVRIIEGGRMGRKKEIGVAGWVDFNFLVPG